MASKDITIPPWMMKVFLALMVSWAAWLTIEQRKILTVQTSLITVNSEREKLDIERQVALVESNKQRDDRLKRIENNQDRIEDKLDRLLVQRLNVLPNLGGVEAEGQVLYQNLKSITARTISARGPPSSVDDVACEFLDGSLAWVTEEKYRELLIR